MNVPDYYAILHITPDATEAEIRRAYHARVRQCHPDLHPQSTAANEQIKHINVAAEILCNPERRRRYDQLYATQRYTFDFTGERGYDVEYTMTITPIEAQHGTQRNLVFHNQQGRPTSLAITIPAGTTAGSRLCCRGQGGPNRAGTHHGDLYVTILIAITQPEATHNVGQTPVSPVETHFRLPDWFSWLLGD